MDVPESRTLYVATKAMIAPQLNHAVAAMILITTAVSSLAHGHHVVWAAAELIVAVTLIVSIVRSIHRRRVTPPTEHLHDHLGWVEILSGIFVGIEAYTKTLGPHHVSFVVVSFLPAFILVLAGLFESRLARRFFIRADEEHLTVRTRRLRKRVFSWESIQQLERGARSLTLRLKDGSAKKLPVRAVWQSDLVSDWICARAVERDRLVVQVAEPEQPHRWWRLRRRSANT